MATYIESVPSLSTGGTLPSTAGTLIRSAEWGIDNVLSNCIIQSEEITETRMTDPTQDQKGAVVSELDYDVRWDLSLTLIGDSEKLPVTGDSTSISVGDTTFSYGGHKWKVASCTYTGQYNNKKTYSVTAYRYWNFPAQGGQ